MEGIRNEQNEDMLYLWLKHLEKAGITHCPVTTLFDSEVYSLKPVTVNGSKIVRDTGFQYQYVQYTGEQMREIVEELKTQNLWPMHLQY